MCNDRSAPKTKDFRTLYSKVQLDIPTDFEFEISRAAFPLLTEMFNSREVYRSVGIVLEDFREKQKNNLRCSAIMKRKNKTKNSARVWISWKRNSAVIL